MVYMPLHSLLHVGNSSLETGSATANAEPSHAVVGLRYHYSLSLELASLSLVSVDSSSDPTWFAFSPPVFMLV